MRTRTLRRATVAATAALVATMAITATPAAAEETGSISGVVVDQDGVPLAGVFVRPTRIVAGSMTGADGTYRIDGLMAGDHRFEFVPPAGSGLVPEYYDDSATFEAAAVIDIEPGEHVEGIDAELVLGGTLTGRMIGTDGTPVVGERVSWNGPEATENGSTTTGLDGRFEVDLLGDRDYRFWFGLAPGELLSAPQPLVVRGQPGRETVLPDVVVIWNGLVAGRVRDPQGNPVAGAKVDLVTWNQPDEIIATAWSAVDGTYRLRGMDRGAWMVRTNSTLSASGLGSSPVPTYWIAGGSTVDLAVAQGSGQVRTTMDLSIVKNVDLTLRRPGAAVVDLGATVLHSGDVEWTTVQVAATGTAGVPSGRLEVRGASGGYLYGSAQLDSAGRATVPANLGVPLPDVSLLYSGDGAYAPANLTVRTSSFVPYPPARGVVATEPWRLVNRVLQPGAPQCTRVAGLRSMPADAVGVMVNVTAVYPAHAGYVVLYPDSAGTGATPAPSAGATVNFEPGATVSNAAFVALSTGGSLCWASPAATGPAGIVIDVTGYVAADAGVALQAHQRILDTRATQSLRPRTATTVQVTGKAGVPTGATAVLLNVAVTNVRTVGHLRVQPGAVGEAVTTHYVPGADKSVAALATLSASGSLTLWSETSRDVDVVLDVVGWVAGSDVYHPITPTRIVDSRPGAPPGQRLVPGPLTADAVYSVKVAGAGVVPAAATSVVLSVTAIGPNALGNLSLYPDSDGTGKTPRPDASNINYVVGRNIPNLAVVALPSNGRINLVSQTFGGTVNVAIEVVGYFTD